MGFLLNLLTGPAHAGGLQLDLRRCLAGRLPEIAKKSRPGAGAPGLSEKAKTTRLPAEIHYFTSRSV
jgi:hypothetical protein